MWREMSEVHLPLLGGSGGLGVGMVYMILMYYALFRPHAHAQMTSQRMLISTETLNDMC